MKPKDIKENTWYKIKGNVFYPYFYAKRLHMPKSVDKRINTYLVEGVHVSNHPPSLDFGLIKYIPPMNLIKYECLPNAQDHRDGEAVSGASTCWIASEDK
jgi:hypothetical protein